MMQIVLIGIGAGAAAALLFASLASASLLSIALFYMAPLPIMIAALGWTYWAGAIAVFAAAGALFAFFSGAFTLAFLAGAGLPAWWLAYLAMMGRPAADGTLEWYPAGRLVLWAAALSSAVVLISVQSFGPDIESYRASLTASLERLVRIGGEGSARGSVLEFMVLALPPAAAVITAITYIFNLWLAGRIVKFSGQLRRPWPDLPAIDFPPIVAGLFAAAGIVSFFGGIVGVMASAAAASLLIAEAVLGFAVMHTITRGMSSRPYVLTGVYGAVVIFGWPVIALCMLGLTENLFALRARFARRAGPPAST